MEFLKRFCQGRERKSINRELSASNAALSEINARMKCIDAEFSAFNALSQEINARLIRLDGELSDAKETVQGLNARIIGGAILSAKILNGQIAARGILRDIRLAEFKVFSQFGEDGIIQYLIRRANIPQHLRTFVEFGVESYAEANTRFLLMNDNWKGLIIDGSEACVDAIRKDPIYWMHDLTAISAFIDADNINDLIRDAGFTGEVGVLSIDIDGVDYWVWDRLNVVKPVIVIVEYNSVFGSQRAVAVPYDPTFVRSKAHHSYLYYGCSLKALELLGHRKGYSLVGSNGAGNNAFFVRNDCLNGQPALTAAEAYVESHFRESRDEFGRLNYLSGAARLREIKDRLVYDIEHDAQIRVEELLS
jgi:hypothetical protein